MLRQNLQINKNFVSSISVNLGRLTPDLNSAEAIRFIREQNWFTEILALSTSLTGMGICSLAPALAMKRTYYRTLCQETFFIPTLKCLVLKQIIVSPNNSPVRHNDEVIGVLSARFYRDKLNAHWSLLIFSKVRDIVIFCQKTELLSPGQTTFSK